jgi:hypothetical protein
MAAPKLDFETRVLFDAIRKERFAHYRTLQHFQSTMTRLATRDATQRISEKMCVLCKDVPVGTNPDRYRSACPHIWRTEVAMEVLRVGQGWDQYKKELLKRMVADQSLSIADRPTQYCTICREHVTPDHYCVATEEETAAADG